MIVQFEAALVGESCDRGPNRVNRPMSLLSTIPEPRSIPICQHPPLPTATWRNLFLKAAAIHHNHQLLQCLTFCPRHSRLCCLHKAESTRLYTLWKPRPHSPPQNDSPDTQDAVLSGDNPARAGHSDTSMAPPILVISLQRYWRLLRVPDVASSPIF